MGATAFTVAYFWIRREWVFRKRLCLVLGGLDLDTVPSFDDMLFRWWWCWDMNSLIKKRT